MIQDKTNTMPIRTAEGNQEVQETVQRTPDKTAYMERIDALPAEDKAFLDGYLFAKVTDAGKKGA